MRILGIEFSAWQMNYVAIDQTPEGFDVHSTSRLSLGSTRSREALIAFQDAVKALFNSTAPDLIAIKEKPESGRLRAGAAALKMEGIALANAPCDVEFVSGARVNRSDASDDSLFSYMQPALKTAAAALAGHGR